MKFVIMGLAIVAMGLHSPSSFSASDAEVKAMQEQLRKMQARIEALEKQKSMQNGLKVKDLRGQSVSGGQGAQAARDLAQTINPHNIKLTPEQQKEIMKTLKDFKQQHKEYQQTLDKIMKEDP